MTITPVIDELITQIKALGITNTYKYMPLTPTGTLMKAAWQDGNILHGCTVTRSIGELDPESGNAADWGNTIIIEVRRTYQDADSQEAHDDELDDIMGQFWGDETLNSTVAGIESARLVENRPYMFFNLLVHYGRIEAVVHLHD